MLMTNIYYLKKDFPAPFACSFEYKLADEFRRLHSELLKYEGSPKNLDRLEEMERDVDVLRFSFYHFIADRRPFFVDQVGFEAAGPSHREY